MVQRCLCWCHNSPDWIVVEDLAALGEGWFSGVACDDAVAAATACSTCLSAHCAALLTPEPGKPEPPPKSVWVDPLFYGVGDGPK